MLKVYIGVVRFSDDRDFIMMVDGEPGPVQEAVRQAITEICGEGEIQVQTEGVDFIELVHASHPDQPHPDGYVLGCEVGGLKRFNYAIQYARRQRHLPPNEAQ